MNEYKVQFGRMLATTATTYMRKMLSETEPDESRWKVHVDIACDLRSTSVLFCAILHCPPEPEGLSFTAAMPIPIPPDKINEGDLADFVSTNAREAVGLFRDHILSLRAR